MTSLLASRRSRPIRRRSTVLAVATTGLLASSTLLAAPAQGAWTTFTVVHEARAQLCQVPLDGGATRVKLRLDNRRAEHTHRAKLIRERGDEASTTSVRARAGKVSRKRSVRVRDSDLLSIGVYETDNVGAGGGVGLDEIRSCGR